MAAVEVTISGVLYDKYSRTTRPVVLIGEASLTGVGIGGGPMPPGSGGDDPVHIWGPTDPRPGYGLPGPQPHPEHPIVIPPQGPPPDGPADDGGFIKAPPEGGGWGYHQTYGWMYDPPGAGPK